MIHYQRICPFGKEHAAVPWHRSRAERCFVLPPLGGELPECNAVPSVPTCKMHFNDFTKVIINYHRGKVALAITPLQMSVRVEDPTQHTRSGAEKRRAQQKYDYLITLMVYFTATKNPGKIIPIFLITK